MLRAMTTGSDPADFDPAEREAQLRRESEQWDTSQTRPAADGEIPVIDVAAWFESNSRRDLDIVAHQLASASEEVGFHQLVGHGLSEQIVAEAFSATRQIHGLSLADKEAIAIDRPDWPVGGVGHLRIGERKLPTRARGNRNEAFLIKSDIGIGFDENQWPSPAAAPSFRPRVEAYAIAASQLAVRLLPAYAVALDLDPAFFAEGFRDPFWRLRLSHYPGLAAREPVDDDFGIAPHVDTTFFTLLRQESPGLTVYRAPSDEWIVVPVVAEAFVVNCGELLRQWSNDRFLSARHFANNSSAESRYSIPFFFNANADHVMQPLPSCSGPGNPLRYPPMSYRQSQAAAQGE